MGRNPLSGTAKENILKIRLTEEERATLDAKAGDEAVSTWARRILLTQPDPPKKRLRKPKGS